MKSGFLHSSCIVLISITLIPSLKPEKILFLLPIATRSQKNVFDPLIFALAERDHELTLVTSINTSGLPTNSSVQEIVISLTDDFDKILPANPFEFRKKGKTLSILAQGHVWRRECEMIYQHEYIQKIIKSPAQHKFDLIVLNGFFNQCMLGLVHVLKAPFIYVTSMASPLFITRFTGNYHPTSFVPLPFLDLSDRMSFVERVYNLCLSYLSNFLHDYAALEYEGMYRKYLGPDVPSLSHIASNVSLILSNEQFALTYPRPNLPDTIDIGGIICRQAENLSGELADFIAGSEHGFIYFSLGSIVRSAHLLEEHRKVFINAFSRLPLRVIWKWNDEKMADLPPNVLVKKWLPQQDILGHPDIKLFITHGGLLSTQEAVYHGVPLLGLPIFVDQDLNMRRAEGQGYALTLEILTLNEEELETTIRRMLSDTKFRRQAEGLSKIFRDQGQTPLERAIFWTEHVLRHKGALHLRSTARDLNVVQINSWDAIGFLCTVLLAVLFALKLIVLKAYSYVTYAYVSHAKRLLKQKIQ